MRLFRFFSPSPREDVAALLYGHAVAQARDPDFYAAGGVPDTLDGRFAVLSTVTALVILRLEREGEVGNEASVALTERFIHVMESEHRELGLGDPTLGKTVRKLVAVLARRVELWREADPDWLGSTRESLYKDAADKSALEHCAAVLRDFARRLAATKLAELEQGKIR
jgi:cytochrome b pre-mRNA-processing protein 3